MSLQSYLSWINHPENTCILDKFTKTIRQENIAIKYLSDSSLLGCEDVSSDKTSRRFYDLKAFFFVVKQSRIKCLPVKRRAV